MSVRLLPPVNPTRRARCVDCGARRGLAQLRQVFERGRWRRCCGVSRDDECVARRAVLFDDRREGLCSWCGGELWRGWWETPEGERWSERIVSVRTMRRWVFNLSLCGGCIEALDRAELRALRRYCRDGARPLPSTRDELAPMVRADP